MKVRCILRGKSKAIDMFIYPVTRKLSQIDHFDFLDVHWRLSVTLPLASCNDRRLSDRGLKRAGHFGVTLCLCFKTSSRPKLFKWKWVSLTCMRKDVSAEHIFIWMVSHGDSCWSRDKKQFGKGLLFFPFHATPQRVHLSSQPSIRSQRDKGR